jgi:hypothetical protein
MGCMLDRLCGFVLTVLLAGAGSLGAAARGAESETDDLLRRAALQHAVQKLVKSARSIPLSPGVRVDDFLRADARLPSLCALLLQDRAHAESRRFHDGSWEVDARVGRDELARILQTAARRIPELGSRWSPRRFESLAVSRDGPLEATGAQGNVDSARSVLGMVSVDPAKLRKLVKQPGLQKARFAAEEDALEKLFRYILYLPVGKGGRFLADHIDPTARTRENLRSYLRETATLVPGSLHYTEDIACELDKEVPVAQVLDKLDKLVKSGIDPRLSELRGLSLPLNRYVRTSGRKIFRVTGFGFPPEDYLLASIPRRPPWARHKIKARGTGHPPEVTESMEEALSLGFQRAQKDAATTLVQHIAGLDLPSGVRIQSLLTPRRRDQLVKLIGKSHFRDIGFSQSGREYLVEVELSLWNVWNVVRKWQK